MERTELYGVLELMEQPAFLAEDGAVCRGNAAFDSLQIRPGTPVHAFLYTDRTMLPSGQPQSFQCAIGSETYTVRLLSVDGLALYILQPLEHTVPAQALANTALSLRRSLQQIYSATELIDDQLRDREAAPAVSSLLQGVFRIERIAENLDYLQRLQGDGYRMKLSYLELRAYFRPLMEKAEALLQQSGIRLDWSLPEQPFYGSVDQKLISLAFWNLLSNAARAGGEQITAAVERIHRDCFLLKVTDAGGQSELLRQEHLMERYRVAPSPADAERGVGIGIRLIRTVSQLHGGSFLLTEDAEGRHTAVMRISTELSGSSELHSPPYFEERSLDDGMVGLAEVLPRSVFHAEDIFG